MLKDEFTPTGRVTLDVIMGSLYPPVALMTLRRM